MQFLNVQILSLFFSKQRRKTKEERLRLQDSAASNQFSIIKDIEEDLKGHDIKVFNYASISAATTSFSSENKLG